jgi:hypothetical protein
MIRKPFNLHRRRLGLDKSLPPPSAKAFRRQVREGDQLPLFA